MGSPAIGLTTSRTDASEWKRSSWQDASVFQIYRTSGDISPSQA